MLRFDHYAKINAKRFSFQTLLFGKKKDLCINHLPETALSIISPSWGLVFMRARNTIDFYATPPLTFR